VIEPRVVDLNACITGMTDVLLRLIGTDIELVLSLDPTLGHVFVDPGQIEQVILSLALNARDAMPQGGRLTIETANVVLDEPYVMIAVRDSGVGVPANRLGLATVYAIVKQSGGYVAAETSGGEGTVMRVYLPLSVPVAVGEPPELEESAASGAVTILLVEDEVAVRTLTRRILMRAGYAVLAAGSAEEALAISQAHPAPIDLLLTDVIMAGAGGARLAGVLQPLRPEMGVLFMSGYAVDTIVREGVLPAGVAYLQKPFTPASLARKVREVLEARSAGPEESPRAAG
jgi:two-component system cell cycle sensor histidine kinase/response regulator CckA